MDRLRAGATRVIPGEDAFRLWDTYGFPLDITRDVAQENGFDVDEAGYQAALEQQRRQSGSDQHGAAADVSVYVSALTGLRDRGLLGADGVRQLIYENAEDAETTVIGLVKDGEAVDQVHAGEAVEVILPETPFYVESGGQVNDTGEIEYFPDDMQRPVWSVRVHAMRRPIPGLIVHVRRRSPAALSKWTIPPTPLSTRNGAGTSCAITRPPICCTPRCAASWVSTCAREVHWWRRTVCASTSPTRSRSARDQLRAIEQAANQAVLANYPVKDRWTGFDRAVAEGALAFFEEKYDDTVRVISIGDGGEAMSQELCGRHPRGNHRRDRPVSHYK